MKQKAFLIIFEGFSIKQLTQIFLEGEGPTLNMSQFKGCWLQKFCSCENDSKSDVSISGVSNPYMSNSLKTFD